MRIQDPGPTHPGSRRKILPFSLRHLEVESKNGGRHHNCRPIAAAPSAVVVVVIGSLIGSLILIPALTCPLQPAITRARTALIWAPITSQPALRLCRVQSAVCRRPSYYRIAARNCISSTLQSSFSHMCHCAPCGRCGRMGGALGGRRLNPPRHLSVLGRRQPRDQQVTRPSIIGHEMPYGPIEIIRRCPTRGPGGRGDLARAQRVPPTNSGARQVDGPTGEAGCWLLNP